MKRLLFIIPFCILLLFGCKTYIFHWAKPFAADEKSWCEQVIRNDYRIYAGLNVGNADGVDCQPVVLNLDFGGHENWIKTYTHGTYSMLSCMYEANDTLFFAGKTIHNDKTLLFIIKIDATGNVLWEKYIEAPGFKLSPEGITVADTKALMLTGCIKGDTGAVENLFVLRLQNTGINQYDVEWFKSYDMTYSSDPTTISHAKEKGVSISHAYDDLCLVAGHFYTPIYNNDPWFLVIKSDGSMDSQGRLKNSGSNTWVSSMKRTSPISQTTEYLVSGGTDHSSSSDNMLALSLELNAISPATLTLKMRMIIMSSEKTNSYANDIDQLTDGSYIIVGENYSSTTSSKDAILIKFNNSTDPIIWSRAYGNASVAGNFTDIFNSVDNAPYHGCVTGGYTQSFPTYDNENAWVMSLNDKGYVDTGVYSDTCMLLGIDVEAYPIDWVFGCMGEMKKVLIDDIIYIKHELQSQATDLPMESLYLCDEL